MTSMYSPARKPSGNRKKGSRIPARIVLIQPCCIGDVVLATATLAALRVGYPDAHITWAVGSWSRPAIEAHDLLDAVLDTGPEALPVRTLSGMMRFVRQLRDGRFDLAVSLVRSPLMSMALMLSGIPRRAGLDSAGRGFGYNIRVKINPDEARHEAEIYLDVARALRIDTAGCYANIPVLEVDQQHIKKVLHERGVRARYIVLNPAGGRNPGMTMDVKRWPAKNFAALAERLTERLQADVVLLGGPGDEALVESVRANIHKSTSSFINTAFVGALSFGEIAALAQGGVVYVGNDTGLTHLAAASGAKTAMILGPSDPARYAPFAQNAIALWKHNGALRRGGVSAGAPSHWNWGMYGIGVGEVERELAAFLRAENAV